MESLTEFPSLLCHDRAVQLATAAGLAVGTVLGVFAYYGGWLG